MKKLLVFISFLIIILLTNCNYYEPTSPNSDNQQSGKVILKVDKENAPESVMWIEAFFTREGYDTISSTMNILSDSTADLLLENIQAGEWNLRVDARDSTGVVLYSGETGVEVFAGFTTQVSLVLEPTGAGVGNIYIWVTWGVPSGKWTDFGENPVLTTTGDYWDYSSVNQPKVSIDNNLLRMYYTAQGSPYSGYIGLAYSNDGINWTIDSKSPVLSPGPAGSWDETAVAAATVIKDENGYKMYYHGWSDPWGPWHIGLATSTDGIDWVKYPDPIIYASDGCEFQLAPSCVIKVDGTYYLYYTGRNLPYVEIGLATSTDGINWTRYSGNPILTYDKEWEGTGIYYPTVYKKSNQYVMIYMNAAGTGFGKATSTDATNWVKDTSNPFFTKNETHNNWANGKIAYPNYIRINNKDRLYYSGYDTGSPPFSIGFLSK